jgi:hypothetical protein
MLSDGGRSVLYSSKLLRLSAPFFPLTVQKAPAPGASDIGHEDSFDLSVYVVYIFATRWSICCCLPKKEGNSKWS